MTETTKKNESWEAGLARPSITPYVMVRGAAGAIEFYGAAFGAREVMRHEDETGRMVHAEIEIGAARVMLSDETAEKGSALALGGSPVSLFLYVEDADAVQARALSAGATEVMALADKDYGRAGGVRDPFGLTWWICS